MTMSRLPPVDFLDGLDIAVSVTGADGGFVYRNPKFVELTAGMAEEEEEIARAAEEAAGGNRVVMAKSGPLVITCVPFAGADGTLVFTQIGDARLVLNLEKRLLDSEKKTVDYAAKLSRANFRDCIASSEAMIRVFAKAKQVASYPTTVLLVGETGVGKEVLASFIHRNSDRADKPLIKVNCSAIPDQLLESELFGYESGAFSGAKTSGKAGLFELANGGTILLDEIGDMNPNLQAKLLRVLQEGEIMRLGGQKTMRLDVRVVSATNRDLKAMMEQGLFSEALFYRLNVVELAIPPLRERREDILPLTGFFLQHFREMYKLEKTLSPGVKECFLLYNWPGNIRELRNMVENLVVSSVDPEIRLDELPRRMVPEANPASAAGEAKEAMAMAETLGDAVENLQRRMIGEALEKCGSLRKAAASLGMDSSTLHRLVKKLRIDDSVR